MILLLRHVTDFDAGDPLGGTAPDTEKGGNAMNTIKETDKHRTRVIPGVILVLIVMLTSVLATGCIGGDSHPDFLTQHEWIHFSSDDETINFGEDGHYSYHCGCGEPVGNSDLFDKYSYDEDEAVIHLKPSGDNDEIRVLRQEKSRLLLLVDGMVKEFMDGNDSMASDARPDEIGYDIDNVTMNFSSYLFISELDGRRAVTAPAGYDGDMPEYEEYLLDERVTGDAEFYDWNLEIVQTENGEEPESSFRKLSREEAEKLVSGGSATGFVWYNEEAEIIKIVFFGSTLYYE